MQPENNAIERDHYVAPGQLRVGLYVHIDLPWFRHPFTRGSFRISSENQIAELRTLAKPRFRYDPARSENSANASLAALAAEVPAPASPAEDEAQSDPAPAADPRIEQLREYRRSVARTEKSFAKAAGIVRRLDKDLLSRPAETLGEMDALVEQMAGVFIERPEVSLQVMGENCGGEEAYHHSLNVSILCMMLVKGLGLSREQAAVLGAGALLHDIGLTEIPDSILKKSPCELSNAERELRAMHVEYGMAISRRLGLAPEVMSIIEQHHELADGSGYPRGLGLEQIAPLARIVSLVNYYENLCNPVDVTKAISPHEALSFIFAKRKDQFDARILQFMVRALGVYPPGSIVQLSNEAVAMVVSINPHKSLRPWVLVYDAEVPKEEAAALNMETEDEISISRTLRPTLLPAHIVAYLSPRQRITYFFDGGPADIGASI